jgi:hypothetical protein
VHHQHSQLEQYKAREAKWASDRHELLENARQSESHLRTLAQQEILKHEHAASQQLAEAQRQIAAKEMEAT